MGGKRGPGFLLITYHSSPVTQSMVLSGWESVFFWAFALAALVAALLTVLARNAVHSALFLISALVSVAALFVLLGAEFIAGVQILVYVGGVMVLFLFVIILVTVASIVVLLGAECIGGVQMLVDGGGVMVLFLLVSILVDVGAEEGEQGEGCNGMGQVTAGVCLAAVRVFGRI